MAEGGGAGAGRSTAIVLFTDLVASTELRTRLGEEAAEEVRRKHDSLVTGSIEANRGRLIKNLGDGVMTTFSGASDAVAAAVAIQQALDRHNRSSGSAVPLEARIGISAGDVVVEEGDCFGTPVIEAARLCAAAQGGQILVTEVVRLLAGSGSTHQFTSLGTVDLKGLAAPVSACAVAWEPLPEPSIPLPTLLARAGRIFVGREEELERLLRLWKEAVTGERRVALVAGEPGIGKTRLAIELAGAVRESGGVVLAGRCDEDLGVPYQPFVEALRYYVAYATEPRLGRYPGELVRVLPDLRDAVRGLPEPLRSDPETERWRLFDAIASWLADMSAEAPVLLVLDDLHWAAKPTLLLLRHALRFADPLRLLVTVTYRDSEIGRGHPLGDLLADLHHLDGVERFPLAGLDRAAVSALIEAAAGHPLADDDEGFPEAVRAETEGNPFFVAEVLRHLTETGAVIRRAGRWQTSRPLAELGIPEGVRHVISRRLSRLPDPTTKLLAVAALIRREFDVALLAGAAKASEDEVLDALEQAEAARLVAPLMGRAGHYSFVHALVSSTLADQLPTSRRIRLHRQIGLALESRPDADARLPELARHFSEAVVLGETKRAVEYARRAGDAARERLAFEEAAVQYERGLAALEVASEPDPPLGCDLRIALGEVLHRSGDSHYRDVLMTAARSASALRDTRRLGEIALALNPVGFSTEPGKADRDVVALIEEALAGLGEADDPLRARLLAVLAVELVWTPDFNRRLALVDEAAGMARRLGDRTTLARVLASAHLAVKDPDHVAERLAWTDELLALGGELGQPEAVFTGHLLRHDDLLGLGQLDAAHADLDAAEQLVTDLRQPLYSWRVATRRAGHALLAGRLGEAEGLIRSARRAGEGAVSAGYTSAVEAHQLLTLRYDQDRMGELEEAAAELMEAMPGRPHWRAHLALIYTETDRLPEALPHLERLTANLDDVPRDVLWMQVMVALASVVATLGDRTRSLPIYERLAPYSGRTGGSIGFVTFGTVDLSLGLLATTLLRFDDARQHFDASIELCQQMGAPTWLARSQLELARMLLMRCHPSDAERAHELLDQALASARKLGLTTVERRAVELLTSQ